MAAIIARLILQGVRDYQNSGTFGKSRAFSLRPEGQGATHSAPICYFCQFKRASAVLLITTQDHKVREPGPIHNVNEAFLY